jgi:glyoxylase-like metal-dependent hydrolase (beta-lactamase superfamily II)
VADVARIVTGRWKENCYVASSPAGDAVVIDPGGEVAQIQARVADGGLRVHAVLNTHAHYDHLGAVVRVAEQYGVPFHLHPADEDLLQRANFYRALFLGDESIAIPSLDSELADGLELSFGTLEVAVVHTPGHTPGSVCLECDGELFTGDTVMAKHLGRTDLPGGDRELLLASVALLAERYPAETVLHPGHGEPAVLGEVLSRLAGLPEFRG